MDLYGSMLVGGPEVACRFTLLICCSTSLNKNPWPVTPRENSSDEYTYTSYHAHIMLIVISDFGIGWDNPPLPNIFRRVKIHGDSEMSRVLNYDPHGHCYWGITFTSYYNRLRSGAAGSGKQNTHVFTVLDLILQSPTRIPASNPRSITKKVNNKKSKRCSAD